MSTERDDTWKPTATRATLELRARLLARARQFFADRAVLEVDTPLVVNAAVTDVHIHSATVDLELGGANRFIHTSPEYAMKRLLAAGSGDIYQICHVVRGAERGRHHNPEFTLIEWYRLGFDAGMLMREVESLVRTLIGADSALRAEYLTYREAFLRHLQVDPLSAELAEIAVVARRVGFTAAPEKTSTSPDADTQAARKTDTQAARKTDTRAARKADTRAARKADTRAARKADTQAARDELLELLMGAVIGPRLGHEGLTFVHQYPASQAALARLDPRDPRVASRFELYWQGVELANGFHELTSAAEQRQRFERDNEQRRRLGLPPHALDEQMLAALAAGMPDCAGVALGFDRLLMVAAGAERIDQVLPFASDRA